MLTCAATGSTSSRWRRRSRCARARAAIDLPATRAWLDRLFDGAAPAPGLRLAEGRLRPGAAQRPERDHRRSRHRQDLYRRPAARAAAGHPSEPPACASRRRPHRQGRRALRSSIDQSLQEVQQRLGDALDLQALTQRIGQARTIHSLLGARPDTRQFRFDADTPLDVDLLIVDETSMVHLEMMAALLQALPPQARLVLLGDKDQLASVEAGSVLGDLCARASEALQPETLAYLEAVSGQSLPLSAETGSALEQQTVMLRHSRRFGSDIGLLARAVNDGLAFGRSAQPGAYGWPAPARARSGSLQARSPRCRRAAGAARAIPRQPDSFADLFTTSATNNAARPEHGPRTPTGSRPCCAASSASASCARCTTGPGATASSTFRSSRRSPAAGLNPRANGSSAVRSWSRATTRRSASSTATSAWCCHRQPRPHAAGLVPRRRPAALGRPQPARHVETCFAMTIHKSQGSEFAPHRWCCPEGGGDIPTRELVYTGVTRAKVPVAGRAQARLLGQAVGRQFRRASGPRAGQARRSDPARRFQPRHISQLAFRARPRHRRPLQPRHA